MTLNWRGAEVERIIRDAALRAIHDGAEHILTEAIDETPVDTGTLRRSGTVTDAPSEGAVYVSFNTPYCIAVHENLNMRHVDGKAKYLEDPYNRNKDAVIELANNRVRQALRSG